MQDPAQGVAERGNAPRVRKTHLAAALVGLGVTLAAVALPEPEGLAGQDAASGAKGGPARKADPAAPSDPAGEKEYADAFVARFQRAQKLFYVKKDDEAAALFRELVKEQPEAGAVHHALGFVEWQRGNVDAAVAAFREAARHSPKDGAVRRDAGFRLLDAGHAAEALTHLDAAHEILDGDVEIEVARGRALLAVGRTSAAEAVLRAAMKLDANSVDARVALASIVLATDPAEALAITAPIPENWPDVVLVRARSFAAKGSADDCSKRLLRMLDIVPEGPAGAPFLGVATDLAISLGTAEPAGKLAEAWAAAEAKTGTVSPSAAFAVAVARSARGKSKEALEALDAAPLPAAAPARLRGLAGLVRVHVLLQTGDAAAAGKAAEAVAEMEGAPFEQAAARRFLGRSTADDLLAAARTGVEADPSLVNDVAWVEALAAWRVGDLSAASKLMATAAERSSPRGEHPGLLAATAFPAVLPAAK
jgi:tetratricopeptide (TPR) repeat protein